jgi:hypothetical protein
MGATVSEIILIYNADWSIAGAVEYLAETLRGTDSCALCEITHNAVSEKRDWKSCKAKLGVDVRGLYRNQLTPELSAAARSFPCVLVAVDGGYQSLLDRKQLETCKGDPQVLLELLRSECVNRGLQLP